MPFVYSKTICIFQFTALKSFLSSPETVVRSAHGVSLASSNTHDPPVGGLSGAQVHYV